MQNRIRYAVNLFLFCILLPYAVAVLTGNAGETEKRVEKTGIFVTEDMGYGTERTDEEAYLTGALAASMPQDVEAEALKAQAVVLRTNLYEAYIREGDQNERSVKAESIGQQYLTPRQMQTLWGEKYEEQSEKYRRVVEETSGEIMTYGGIPIKAPYFYVSAGATRNGGEALQEESCPYLLRVECPMDVLCPEYSVSLTYSEGVFWNKTDAFFDVKAENETKKRKAEELLLERDESGYVLKITDQKSGKSGSGEAFRKAFDLPSSYFSIEQDGTKVILTVKGQGHGIGMSQYGAGVLAGQGKDYHEILTYFFQGIQIQKNE